MPLTAAQLVALAREAISEIDNEQARILMSQEIRILDVREPAEFAAGHLPGAINIPRGVLEFKIASHPNFQLREEPILVCCQSGGRGALACQTLKQLGFAKAINLQQGYGGWGEEK